METKAELNGGRAQGSSALGAVTGFRAHAGAGGGLPGAPGGRHKGRPDAEMSNL